MDSTTTQQAFEFATAEAESRNRLIQLGRALRDLDANANLCLLARLIYDNTNDGLGDPWKPEGGDETVFGHAWGPRIKRSAIYTLKKTTAYRKLLIVSEGGYQINWPGVYAVRGLPLPASLAIFNTGARMRFAADPRAASAASGLLFECGNRTEAAALFPEPESISWTNQSRSWTGESRTWTEKSRNWTPRPSGVSPQCAPDAPTRARLSSCLNVLTTSSSDIEAVRTKAQEFSAAIFAHKPGAKMRRDSETRRFLACLAAIALQCGNDWAESIDAAVAITARKRADSPTGFLHNVLRNVLRERLGLCRSDEEATAALGQLLAAATPSAKAALAGWSEPPPREDATAPAAMAMQPTKEKIAEARSVFQDALASVKNKQEVLR